MPSCHTKEKVEENLIGALTNARVLKGQHWRVKNNRRCRWTKEESGLEGKRLQITQFKHYNKEEIETRWESKTYWYLYGNKSTIRVGGNARCHLFSRVSILKGTYGREEVEPQQHLKCRIDGKFTSTTMRERKQSLNCKHRKCLLKLRDNIVSADA